MFQIDPHRNRDPRAAARLRVQAEQILEAGQRAHAACHAAWHRWMAKDRQGIQPRMEDTGAVFRVLDETGEWLEFPYPPVAPLPDGSPPLLPRPTPHEDDPPPAALEVVPVEIDQRAAITERPRSTAGPPGQKEGRRPSGKGAATGQEHSHPAKIVASHRFASRILGSDLRGRNQRVEQLGAALKSYRARR